MHKYFKPLVCAASYQGFHSQAPIPFFERCVTHSRAVSCFRRASCVDAPCLQRPSVRYLLPFCCTGHGNLQPVSDPFYSRNNPTLIPSSVPRTTFDGVSKRVNFSAPCAPYEIRIYRAGGLDPATLHLERNLIAISLKERLLTRPALEDLEKRGIKPQQGTQVKR